MIGFVSGLWLGPIKERVVLLVLRELLSCSAQSEVTGFQDFMSYNSVLFPQPGAVPISQLQKELYFKFPGEWGGGGQDCHRGWIHNKVINFFMFHIFNFNQQLKNKTVFLSLYSG